MDPVGAVGAEELHREGAEERADERSDPLDPAEGRQGSRPQLRRYGFAEVSLPSQSPDGPGDTGQRDGDGEAPDVRYDQSRPPARSTRGRSPATSPGAHRSREVSVPGRDVPDHLPNPGCRDHQTGHSDRRPKIPSRQRHNRSNRPLPNAIQQRRQINRRRNPPKTRPALSSPGTYAPVGRRTGTTVSRLSSPLKSSGFVVNKGSSSATAILAIIRSAIRPRGVRPAPTTAAQIRP